MSDFELYEKSGTARALDNIRQLYQQPQDVHRTEGYQARFKKLQKNNDAAKVDAMKNTLTDFDKAVAAMSEIRQNMGNVQESVTWLTDSGSLMREKQEFYEKLYLLAKERQLIRTIINSFDDLCSFQRRISEIEPAANVDVFREIVQLEQLSSQLCQSFGHLDNNEVMEKLEKFRDDVNQAWGAFEEIFVAELWKALTTVSPNSSGLIDLIQQRNQLDLANHKKQLDIYPRFLEQKANEYFVQQITDSLSAAADVANTQHYLKKVRSDVAKLLQLMSESSSSNSPTDYYVLAYQTCRQHLINFITAYIEENKETIEINQIGALLAFNKTFRADMEKMNEDRSLQTESFKLLRLVKNC